MSPQLVYALKRVGILVALAVLGVLGQHVSDFALDPTLAIVISALIACLIQVFDGWQDTVRAKIGKIIPSDVGYKELTAYRAEPVRPIQSRRLDA